jgi:MscS family membrane protein
MSGTALIRTVLLALGVLCWVPVALAQSSIAGNGAPPAPTEPASSAWFRVGELNAGLPPAPPGLDRATPMGTVESFIAAAGADRHAEAAHMLDLSRVPVAEQAERGPMLAAKLGTLIQNDIWIDWSELPDRPDALVEGVAGTQHLRAGRQGPAHVR